MSNNSLNGRGQDGVPLLAGHQSALRCSCTGHRLSIDRRHPVLDAVRDGLAPAAEAAPTAALRSDRTDAFMQANGDAGATWCSIMKTPVWLTSSPCHACDERVADAAGACLRQSTAHLWCAC